MKGTSVFLVVLLKLVSTSSALIIEKLFQDVVNHYMKNASCLVLASDHGLLEIMDFKNSMLRLDTSKCPNGLDIGLIAAFRLNCDQ